MLHTIKALWRNIRRLSGDDAYEQYLQHYAMHQAELEHRSAENPQHENQNSEKLAAPLSRKEFFNDWQDKKWKGIKRCC